MAKKGLQNPAKIAKVTTIFLAMWRDLVANIAKIAKIKKRENCGLWKNAKKENSFHKFLLFFRLLGKFEVFSCPFLVLIFSHSKKNSCWFCDFWEICGLLEVLRGLSSYNKSRNLLNLFLLFLPYLLPNIFC